MTDKEHQLKLYKALQYTFYAAVAIVPLVGMFLGVWYVSSSFLTALGLTGLSVLVGLTGVGLIYLIAAVDHGLIKKIRELREDND